MLKRAIAIVPQISHIELIQRLRQAYDPLAATLPPHLTLVFPFESDISPEHLLRHLVLPLDMVDNLTNPSERIFS
jgi:hypothetical protein